MMNLATEARSSSEHPPPSAATPRPPNAAAAPRSAIAAVLTCEDTGAGVGSSAAQGWAMDERDEAKAVFLTHMRRRPTPRGALGGRRRGLGLPGAAELAGLGGPAARGAGGPERPAG
ncbi:unnamed protein product, partial [Prorocentrum cordatum]